MSKGNFVQKQAMTLLQYVNTKSWTIILTVFTDNKDLNFI